MKSRRTVFMAGLLSLCLLLLQVGAPLAQDTTAVATTTDTTPTQRRAIAWTNPILFVFGWYIVEGEIRLQQNHTVGVSASFVDLTNGESSDVDYEKTEYFSVNVFYRYYPTASFKGFFIGGQLGTAQVKQTENLYDPLTDTITGTTTSEGSAFAAGVLIGYGWVLGDAQRVAVSLGLGANRLFGGDVDEDAGLTVPVVRLINVGVAF